MKKKLLAVSTTAVVVLGPVAAMAVGWCDMARVLPSTSNLFLCAMDILFSLMTGGGGAV
jgi:hypothetical protein